MSIKEDKHLFPYASQKKPSQWEEDSPSPNTGMSKKWSTLFVTTASTSLVFLDQTILPVALPTIENELHFSPVGAMWIVNIYLLTLISLLLIGGRLVDLFGKRKIYFLSFALFGLGSVLGGFSGTTYWLIISRMLQGMGGALMLPTTGALLMERFPPQERAKALGINTGISSLFLLLGPVLGGVLTHYVSWRYIFWVNLPILIYGSIMCQRLLPPEKKSKESFDLLGAFPLMFSIITLVVALMEGASWGWRSPLILTLFILSPIFFVLYLLIAKKESPLIDRAIFRMPLFTITNFCIFMAQLALIVTVQWAVYFQEGLGYSPLQTGLLILSATSPILFIAPLSGLISQYSGPKIPMIFGFLLLIFSFVWIHFYSTFPIGKLIPGLISFGCGIPLIFSPAFATAMKFIAPKHLGLASGMITLGRQLAATLGIALMTAIFQSVFLVNHSYQEAFSATLFFSMGVSILGLFTTLFGINKKYLN